MSIHVLGVILTNRYAYSMNSGLRKRVRSLVPVLAVLLTFFVPISIDRYWIGGRIRDLTFTDIGVVAKIKTGREFFEIELTGWKAVYAHVRVYLLVGIFFLVMIVGRGLTGPKNQGWFRSAFSRD